MPYYIKKHKIKTVLNLRGFSNASWHSLEANITKKLGAKLIDYDMSNSKVYSYEETLKILKIVINAKKPILIHCLGGADRTSLISAIYQYGAKNKTEDEAKEQLVWYYGHMPLIRPHVKAMDKSFEIFIKEHNNTKL
jgi:protein tyrosine/serine phosphatase